MARKQKLKVFRTPIGFHDAYVAAPSQKAALEAWGSDSNLFASGAAEKIDDPELTREPLASPGKVIKRVRGTMAEHLAALPKNVSLSKTKHGRSAQNERKDQPSHNSRSKVATSSRSGRGSKPKPRPDRAELDQAEMAIAEVEQRHKRATAELEKRQAELDRDRSKLEAAQARERRQLGAALKRKRAKFDRAMQAWRDS